MAAAIIEHATAVRQPAAKHVNHKDVIREDSVKKCGFGVEGLWSNMERVKRGLSNEMEKIVGFVIGSHVALHFFFIILYNSIFKYQISI